MKKRFVLIGLILFTLLTACNNSKGVFKQEANSGLDRYNVFVGSFVKIPIKVGQDLENLEFRIPSGNSAGQISLSHEEGDNSHSYITLLGGYNVGNHIIHVVNKTTGVLLDSLPFSITNNWTENGDGPNQWYSGIVKSSGKKGALWGGGNEDEPESYDAKEITGDYPVALIFFDTPQQRWQQDEVDSLKEVWQGKMNTEVIPWFDETSYGKLNVSSDVYGPFSTNSNWSSLYKGRDTSQANSTISFSYKSALFRSILSAADEDVDFRNYKSFIFIAKSQTSDGFLKFPWPSAGTVTALINDCSNPCAITVGTVSMPAEWESIKNRPIGSLLAHEICHNLGLGDIYAYKRHTQDIKDRAPGAWAMMANGDEFPHLLLAHKIMLGWIDAEDVKLFNFGQNAGRAVDESVTLSPISLRARPNNTFKGIEVRRAAGWNYYYEFRKTQANGIGDQNLPTDSRVVGTDVSFLEELDIAHRRKAILLQKDLGDGPILDIGGVYSERDESSRNNPNEFEIEVTGINNNEATVRVKYGVSIQPDPSIRPWSRSTWQSEDIEVSNERSEADELWKNVPWANNINKVTARITNRGAINAPQVKVKFRVKNYNISDAPAADLTPDVQDIPAGATVEFTTEWMPRAEGHFCIEADIELYQHPVSRTIEITQRNNLAQSNYTRFVSSTSSPAKRVRIDVTVTNPYNYPATAWIHLEQSNPLYISLLEKTTVNLNANESQIVKCWFEYAYGDRELPAGSTAFMENDNVVSIYSTFTAGGKNEESKNIAGGALVHVTTGKETEIVNTEVTASSVIGKVIVKSDDVAVRGGNIILRYQEDETDPLSLVYNTVEVNNSGNFRFNSSNGNWTKAILYYIPARGYSDTDKEIIR
ncbi:MAG: hypothetical protein JKY48_14650 [Flavobacteriales bacterium]|nr:hypothetical protein [Flavobacteriales bacterium]